MASKKWVRTMQVVTTVAGTMGATLSQAQTTAAEGAGVDPYLWLEEVTGTRALAWVEAQNVVTKAALETSAFSDMQKTFLTILDSKDRIPAVSKSGAYYYNFWRDAQHVHGIWRRTTLEEYRKESPTWETVLDIDALNAAEKANWVWKGQEMREPTYDRCLVMLSRGGADATEVREFDLMKKAFVSAAEGAFVLPEAKTNVGWKDRDTLYVATDFGPGSLTTSGYARIVKEWKRGTPLTAATTVFEGQHDDMMVTPLAFYDHGRVYEMIDRRRTIFTSDTLVRQGDKWLTIEKPADAEVMTFGNELLLRLKSDWMVNGRTFKSGSLLVTDFDSYLKGSRDLQTLFVPTGRTSLSDVSFTKSFIILNVLENVTGHPYLLQKTSTGWERKAIDAPALASVGVRGIDSNESDAYFMGASGFLTPSSLYLGTAGKNGRELLKNLPAFFDADVLQVQQHHAISKDGTLVPYFEVSRKGLALNGNNPTLLYGYGGFEISLTPGYSATLGTGWLDKGGVYVLANIRGGGEFGPDWHNAARKEHRQRGYDDFIAIAEDLIARKVTSPKHLGIQGGSNGGLLMGVMLTQRPDLFGAVLCQVPLLDMRRFNQMLAGASWMGEYGNPDDPADWVYIRHYSPYQNVRPSVHYPPVLFMTSTRDDRVHPGHARKMAALMEAEGANVLFYENTQGGHAGAANNVEIAHSQALGYSFLWSHLQ